MALPEISPYLSPNLNRVSNPTLPVMPTFAPKTRVERVKGVDGAHAFQMALDSSAIVVDEDLPVVWFLATDQNGSKTVVQGYSISPYTPPKPVTMEDLLAEMREMKERLNKMEGENDNGESDLRATGRNESGERRSGSGNGNGQGAPVGKPAGNAEPK